MSAETLIVYLKTLLSRSLTVRGLGPARERAITAQIVTIAIDEYFRAQAD